jgi:hypothetical protein
MGINASQLRFKVIRPVLANLKLWSQAAENLVIGTCAQESLLGTYITQVNGPALGIYQCEPATHKDLWENYINFNQNLKAKILEYVKTDDIAFLEGELIVNLAYATAIARIHYLRIKEALPDAASPYDLGMYWKKYYNTRLGKGTPEEFVKNYTNLVLNGK